MLSILLYGRNDAYGALAQRRSALSLNAFAETLTHKNDEIIFVDYNTDDDKLTFVEEIADTLTDKARACLRVIRVRPAQHALLAKPQAPPVVESIARNIGLRLSNPANRWVLSTNPDIVLVPPTGGLGELLAGLDDGYYGVPRFELPRFVWQRLSRRHPQDAIETIVRLAPRLHLNEEVKHYLPSIGFDAPGDFQLVLRSDLIAIGGFNEAMQQAWHVDANLMARLAWRHGEARSLADHLKIYHCEHTADTIAKHAGNRTEDNFDAFVHDVDDPLANSGVAWGGGELEFETFRLQDVAALGAAENISRVIGPPQTNAYTGIYGPQSYGQVPRIDQHALTFVMDRLVNFPRTATLGWLGCETELRALVQEALVQLGFIHPMLYDVCAERLVAVDIILIDNPPHDARPEDARRVWSGLRRVVADERARIDRGLPRRRILAINAINSDFEAMLRQTFDVVLSPFTTRLRPSLVSGFLKEPVSWLAELQTGDAGARVKDDEAIQIQQGHQGHVFFGPYKILLPGTYRGVITAETRQVGICSLVLEVVWGETFLAQKDVTLTASTVTWTIDFTVPDEAITPGWQRIQMRLWSDGRGHGYIKSARIEVPSVH